MSVAAEVEQFILQELMLGGGVESLDPDENLLATGIVDSHGVMKLVVFLNERYAITVPDEELTAENFQSIQSIDAFVQRVRGAVR